MVPKSLYNPELIVYKTWQLSTVQWKRWELEGDVSKFAPSLKHVEFFEIIVGETFRARFWLLQRAGCGEKVFLVVVILKRTNSWITHWFLFLKHVATFPRTPLFLRVSRYPVKKRRYAVKFQNQWQYCLRSWKKFCFPVHIWLQRHFATVFNSRIIVLIVITSA